MDQNVSHYNNETNTTASTTAKKLFCRYSLKKLDCLPTIVLPNQEGDAIQIFRASNTFIYVMTQNENGPCPLVALMNVLILRNDVMLPQHMIDSQSASASDLINILADYLLQKADSFKDSKDTWEKTFDDVQSVLQRLVEGIDVNVHFNSPNGFELTSEINLFDLARVTLCHGWLPNPNDAGLCPIIKELKTYNRMVECCIASNEASHKLKTLKGKEKLKPDESADVDQHKEPKNYDDVVDNTSADSSLTDREALRQVIERGQIVKHFLDSTATQMTLEGIATLVDPVKSPLVAMQPACFFRNNHFSVILLLPQKFGVFGGGLVTLVTDEGYLNNNNIVWETLTNVDGDNQFLNSAFELVQLSSPTNSPRGSDMEIAMQLQKQEINKQAIYNQQQQHLKHPRTPNTSSPLSLSQPLLPEQSMKPLKETPSSQVDKQKSNIVHPPTSKESLNTRRKSDKCIMT